MKMFLIEILTVPVLLYCISGDYYANAFFQCGSSKNLTTRSSAVSTTQFGRSFYDRSYMFNTNHIYEQPQQDSWLTSAFKSLKLGTFARPTSSAAMDTCLLEDKPEIYIDNRTCPTNYITAVGSTGLPTYHKKELLAPTTQYDNDKSKELIKVAQPVAHSGTTESPTIHTKPSFEYALWILDLAYKCHILIYSGKKIRDYLRHQYKEYKLNQYYRRIGYQSGMV